MYISKPFSSPAADILSTAYLSQQSSFVVLKNAIKFWQSTLENLEKFFKLSDNKLKNLSSLKIHI